MCTRGLALTRRVPPLPNISPLLEQDSHSATAISRGGGPKNRSVRDFTQKQLDNCAKLESRKLEPNGLGIGLWRLALRLQKATVCLGVLKLERLDPPIVVQESRELRL